MSSNSIQLTVDGVKKLVPFNSLSDTHVKDAMKRAKAVRVPGGKMVFKRGQTTTQRFYLLEGSVDLCDADFNITPVKAGEPYSIHALDPHAPHKVSAVTTSDSVLLVVDQKHLDLVLTWDQAGNYLVADINDEEDDMSERDWMSQLLQSNLFSQVPPANIQQLFVTFESMSADAGELIIEQGEVGDLFYVIETGMAQVIRRSPRGEEEILATLGPGDFFGEEALISDAPRNASVRMTQNGNLMFLEKDQFGKLLREPVLQYVSQEELLKHQENEPVVLLDIRLPSEYEHDHEANTINIPLPELREKVAELDSAFTYAIVGESGPRSELGAYLLKEAGLEAVIVQS
ncbi:MAG: cyclic nucleotide-binding domain-containing protein [Ketobacteraceae bacterium]|nr:cyclic nucleotide-binding domain-containing protein [Ketobacteraceae bacterium]